MACGEPSLRKLQRSVTSKEFTFWRAYEEVEGPIGYGSLLKLAAWLAWTQFDGRKVDPDNVLDMIEAFLKPLNEAEELEGQGQPRELLEKKLMQIFKHPELHQESES